MLNKTEEFIKKANLKHNNYYMYGKTDYINIKTKVIITCPIHGDFTQTPEKHLKGRGCRKCGCIKQQNRRRMDIKDVTKNILKACPEHIKPLFRTYTNNNERLLFNCSKHGNFTQTYSWFIKGKNCGKCGHERGGEKLSFDTPMFILKSKLKHGDKYDYTKSVYTGVDDNIIITCPVHGDFLQKPRNHWDGSNCHKCNIIEAGIATPKSLEQFKIDASKVHNNFYNYDKVVYVNNKTNVIITCPLHGDFEARPDNHINLMQGCNKCRQSKGENKISMFLDLINVEYKKEFTFINSRYRYDFCILNNKILLEYDGIQHFKAVDYFGGVKALKMIKLHDMIKNRLAKKNGYYLIRLHYNLINNLENSLIYHINKKYKYFYKNKFYKNNKEISTVLLMDGLKDVLLKDYGTTFVLTNYLSLYK